MRGCRFISVLILASAFEAAAATASPAVSPAEVVAAERAFAADAEARGFVAAFKKYAAADAIGFQPDPVNVQQSLANEPDEPANRTLKWWPVWAGIAQSGDLGFTTGPYTSGEKRFGHYFTVWARQTDGSWRWIYDGGPGNETKSPLGPDTEPTYLPTASAAAGSAEQAWQDVAKLESTLAAGAKANTKAAYLAALSDDARLMGSREQPATDAPTRAAELDRRASVIDFAPLGGRASKAGDLVYTYGDAKWARNGEPTRGHYVRIWQMRTGGWRIVFDEILIVPPAPKPSP
jgi:hypothetical protein